MEKCNIICKLGNYKYWLIFLVCYSIYLLKKFFKIRIIYYVLKLYVFKIIFIF